MKATNFNDQYRFISFLAIPNGTNANVERFQPYSIERKSDKEIFSIGDFFEMPNMETSDGKTPNGMITGFSAIQNTVFIKHTWSGVGFDLATIKKVKKALPSTFQFGQTVAFGLLSSDGVTNKITAFRHVAKATVTGVHFFNKRIKYDLEVNLGGNEVTRIYNIDEAFVGCYEENNETPGESKFDPASPFAIKDITKEFHKFLKGFDLKFTVNGDYTILPDGCDLFTIAQLWGGQKK